MSDSTTAISPTVEVLSTHSVPDSVIDEVAAEIRNLQREATLGFALRLGSLIVNRLYNGDIHNWRSRAAKDVSFRKLTERLPEELSASTLFRAVSIYELDQRIGGVSNWQHLGISHVRAVLALPEKEQKRILKHAEEKEWTVDKVQDEVMKVKRKSEPQSRGGRRPLPVFLKSINHLRRYADKEELLLGDIDEVHKLDNEQRLDLERTLTVLQNRLGQLIHKLHQSEPDQGG